MSNFDDIENNATRDAIHRSLQKKWDLFLFFIKNYLNLKFHYLSVVDFGGGNGNTEKTLLELYSIRNSLSSNAHEYLLYSYDVSLKNVSECKSLNFESKTICTRIYNRNFLETLFDNCAVNLVILQNISSS